MYEPFVIHDLRPAAKAAKVAKVEDQAVTVEAEQSAPTLGTFAALLAARGEPPFGGLPARYGPAFEALCAERPPGVDSFVWWAAAFDVASTLSFWGMELARLGWTSADLFAAPHGLAWFLRGDPVVMIGPRCVFTKSGRIFERVS
jgi:hypothetical protein